jgi:hypothetical protein
VNGDVLVGGGVFQESALNVGAFEANECGSKKLGRTRTRAGKNPLAQMFHNRESNPSKRMND